jgi:hypothetical protein
MKRVPPRQTAVLTGLLLFICIFDACGYPGIPRKPSLNLPIPPDDLTAIRKSNRVYLSWTVPTRTADRLPVKRIGETHVCRSLNSPLTACSSVVGVIPSTETVPVAGKNKRPAPQKRTAEFIDTIKLFSALPSDHLTYAVEALSPKGRSSGLSNQVEVSAAPTLPAPAGLGAQATAYGVCLRWSRAHASNEGDLTFRYRVYRRESANIQDTMVGESALDSPELIDKTIEWEKVYSYRVNVVTVVKTTASSSEIEGDDSAAVQIFTHDVFPPTVPKDLEAVYSGVGQQPFVDLVWSPDSEADLAGYEVYRRQLNGQAEKINSEIVKTPAYRDTKVVPGNTYFYSVSAIDVRNNESQRSPETAETVP